MKKLKSILLTLVVSAGAVGLSAGRVEAGSYCYAPQAYRSGSYVTYSSYGGGDPNRYHRVRVYKSGVWSNGPWVRGSGHSNITLYHPDRNGTGTCQVLT